MYKSKLLLYPINLLKTTNKMERSIPRFNKILKNGVEIKIIQEEFDNILSFTVQFPEEQAKQITQLNKTLLQGLGVTVEENEMKYNNMCYTYGLKDSLISNVIVLKNKNKIPHFEYKMISLLKFIVQNYKFMPTCQLRDFFVGEGEKGVELFGKIGYFVDLTSPQVVEFYSQESEYKNHIEIVNVVHLMKEIREYVRTSETYKQFDEFIERIETFTTIEQISVDPFYLLCLKRIEIPIIEYNEIEKRKMMSIGGIYNVWTGKYNEMGVCLKEEHRRDERDLIITRLHMRQINVQIALYDNQLSVPLIGLINRENETPIIVEERLRENLYEYIKGELAPMNNTISLFELHQLDTLIMMTDILTISLMLRQNGIVHRDIKTNNFLLTYDNRCILSDFMAVTIENDGQRIPIGTPLYMPEDAHFAMDIFSHDVHSIGMTLVQFFLPNNFYEYFRFYQEGMGDVRESILQKFDETIERVTGVDKHFLQRIQPIIKASISRRENTRATHNDLYVLRDMTIDFLKKQHNYDYDRVDAICHFLPFYEELAQQEQSIKQYVDKIKEDGSSIKEQTKEILKQLMTIAIEQEERRKEIFYQIRIILSFGIICRMEFEEFLNENEGFSDIYNSQ